ncbi:phosphinothricin N-acetyltransferase [Xanthomonas fragariae]|nr:phosphinothricin acetyltransferase [Xanthomonas fragariae]SMQ95448.1 phosphinothricin N-acetyltransferase [Xanthomonas fragariae]
MPVELRAVHDADIPAITAIHTEQIAGVNTYEYNATSSDEIRIRVRVIVDAGYPCLIAELDLSRCRHARPQRRQMITVIGDAGNRASQRLHERFGFRTVGVFTGIDRKHSRWLDSVQMQRALGTGDTAPPSDE